MPVPVMPGMKPGGGIPPVGLGNNSLLAGSANSLGTGAGVGQGGAMAAVGGALPDKMNTLFIGSIAPGINKVAMEKLLRVSLSFVFFIISTLLYFINQKAENTISDTFCFLSQKMKIRRREIW